MPQDSPQFIVPSALDTLFVCVHLNLTLRPWIVGVKDFINGYRHAYVDALSEVLVNKLFQHLSVLNNENLRIRNSRLKNRETQSKSKLYQSHVFV